MSEVENMKMLFFLLQLRHRSLAGLEFQDEGAWEDKATR